MSFEDLEAARRPVTVRCYGGSGWWPVDLPGGPVVRYMALLNTPGNIGRFSRWSPQTGQSDGALCSVHFLFRSVFSFPCP